MLPEETSNATKDNPGVALFSLKSVSIVSGSPALSSALTLALLVMLLAAHPAQGQTETVLYNFTCQTDGCKPVVGLVVDEEGNLYGTNPYGGAYGPGVVYKLAPSGTFTVLYSFMGSPDGSQPYAGLILDSKGNLYGTTAFGGADGFGTVFEVTPSGTETVLHSFSVTDGAAPQGLVFDKKGDLYGTTAVGGNGANGGTVFELTPSTGAFTTLYSFTGGADGNQPAGVVPDKEGNLYGITYDGGTSGFGVVFKVTPSGTETVLHNFTPNGEDGFSPNSGLIINSKGNLYGTTTQGGASGAGTVFKVTPSGTETILHSFTGAPDGIFPYAGVILYKGNLYGTTYYGGSSGLGTAFKLTPSGKETILHSFADNGTDGYFPDAGLAIDKAGNLYGTTLSRGNGSSCGVYG